MVATLSPNNTKWRWKNSSQRSTRKSRSKEKLKGQCKIGRRTSIPCIRPRVRTNKKKTWSRMTLRSSRWMNLSWKISLWRQRTYFWVVNSTTTLCCGSEWTQTWSLSGRLISYSIKGTIGCSNYWGRTISLGRSRLQGGFIFIMRTWFTVFWRQWLGLRVTSTKLEEKFWDHWTKWKSSPLVSTFPTRCSSWNFSTKTDLLPAQQ